MKQLINILDYPELDIINHSLEIAGYKGITNTLKNSINRVILTGDETQNNEHIYLCKFIEDTEKTYNKWMFQTIPDSYGSYKLTISGTGITIMVYNGEGDGKLYLMLRRAS